MSALVTFRLDDDAVKSMQYLDGPKGVFYPRAGKTKRQRSEPVAIRNWGDEASNSTLAAADASELAELFAAAIKAACETTSAIYKHTYGDEVREAETAALNAAFDWIREHVDDPMEYSLLRLKAARAENDEGEEGAS